MQKLVLAIAVVVAISVACGGCSPDGRKSTSQTTGTVIYSGKPVAGGTLTFNPATVKVKELPGKPAFAVIQPDGTFSFSTYGNGDGAVIGKGKLSFIAPRGKQISPTIDNKDGTFKPGQIEPSPYAGCAIEEPEVEIKPEGNRFKVKLWRKSASQM